jgi:hypothetical protein
MLFDKIFNDADKVTDSESKNTAPYTIGIVNNESIVLRMTDRSGAMSISLTMNRSGVDRLVSQLEFFKSQLPQEQT